MAGEFDLKPSRRARFGIVVLIVLLHLAVIAGLIRAFAPGVTTAVVDKALSVLTVTVTTPEPEPDPAPLPDEGASGERGRKAKPTDASAPKAPIPVRPKPTPPAASTGAELESGASESGAGTGGAHAGAGTGSGQGGSGQGGGAVRGVEKIAGDINSAKDYPRETRDLRIGHSVTILLAVGTDGRVTGCRVTSPSPDAEADAITCRLATKRFRFRPATDAAGNAVPGKYAWRQRWFY